jgi:hypothetical protein
MLKDIMKDQSPPPSKESMAEKRKLLNEFNEKWLAAAKSLVHEKLKQQLQN